MDPTEQKEHSVDDGLGFGNNDDNSFSEQRELANEMNQNMGSQNGDDPFGQAIPWEEHPDDSSETEKPDEQPEETEQHENEQEESTGEEEQPEEPSGEEEAESEGDDTETKEETVDGDTEEIEEEQQQPDETFYDAKRDFPDMDIDPTSYKNRVDLNEGVAAKVKYLSQIREQLKDADSGLGAIQLPELFDNSEQFLTEPIDREMFASQDGNTAKKTAAQLDQSIKLAKSKLENSQQQQKQKEQVQQVSEEFNNAVNNIVSAIDAFGIDRGEAERMQPSELLRKADDEINDIVNGEKGQELIDEKGLGVYNQYVQKMRQHRQAISDFPDAYEKHQKAQERAKSSKGKRSSQSASPEEIEGYFDEFKQDNPNLDMFKSATIEPEQAFRSFVDAKIMREGYKINSPRDFIKLYGQYQNMLNKQSARYGKSTASKEKATTKSKGGEQRADKSNKKKPPIHKVKGKGKYDSNKVTTQQIDNNLDDLAAELNNI